MIIDKLFSKFKQGNNTQEAVEKSNPLDGLNDTLKPTLKQPSLYQFSEREQDIIVESVQLFFKNIIEKSQPELAATFKEDLTKALDFVGDKLFLNVTGEKAAAADYLENKKRHWDKTSHKTATHLEIGTWIAWPDERVEEYIKNENIGDFIRLDMNPAFKPDLAASATAIPLADNSVDRVSSNSLFEHVAYPHEILKEVYRILKPGGVFYTAVPFHFVQHDCPSDYLRYTGAFFEDVCKDLGFSEVHTDTKSTSGVYYTIHNLAKAAIVEQTLQPAERNMAQLFHTAILMLLGSAQALDNKFLAYGASHWHTTNILAVKKGDYVKRTDKINRNEPFVKRWQSQFISPDTKEPLFLENNKLQNKNKTLEYDVVDGIPVLLPKINTSTSILEG
jgi:predicted SAM-dependent methyltransferase/uncharacterized protein YbaR (Trm112 family)